MTQRNSKTVARSSKTLYREGGPGTLVGEGKGGRRFWGSQVCVASTVDRREIFHEYRRMARKSEITDL